MTENQKLPLHGIRVLDLGHTVMGPACGMILADLGAEVYKIERPQEGDSTRGLKGLGAGLFYCYNRNKKSLGIDLKKEEGVQLFLQLIEQVDVVIENFGPGVVARLGIDEETCRSRNPSLVYCSLKGFFPGPYGARPALDEVVQMMSGLAYMTGPEGRPLRAGASVTDILGACFGVIGILAALQERSKRGQGHFVSSALFETAAMLMGQHMAAAQLTGEPICPMPERGRTWAVYDLFTTSDEKQVFIGLTSKKHWHAICQMLGLVDWAHDARFADNQERMRHRHLFLPILQQKIQTMALNEACVTLEKAQIPFAPVRSPQDLLQDTHLLESNSFVRQTTAQGTNLCLPGLPLRFDKSALPLTHEAPLVGEGGHHLLSLIGIDKSSQEDLVKKGIISLDPT